MMILIAVTGTNGIDFMLFSTMCQMRYDRMPKLLCECLFRAFSSDLKRRVDPTDFIKVLALVRTCGRSICIYIYEVNRNTLIHTYIHTYEHTYVCIPIHIPIHIYIYIYIYPPI